jgi:hypothetical protein
MQQQNFEFRKPREFSDLISDTFVFCRQQWKPLIKSVAVICGFFILLTVVFSFAHQNKLFSTIRNGSQPSFGIELVLSSLSGIIAYFSISLVTYSFIALYREKGNQTPSVEEVWGYFKYYFFRFLTANFLLVCLAGLGFVFCIAPGVYLYPIISIIAAVMVFENGDLSYSFSRGFRLIKGEWWASFGAMMIIMMILYAIFIAIAIPSFLLTSAATFIANAEVPTGLLLILSVFQSLAYVSIVLLYVITAICYFSLVEKKDGDSLLDRVNNIGNNDLTDNLPEEQY